jgi:hypothetical protein
MHSYSGNFTPVTEQSSALISDAIMVTIVAFVVLLSFQLYVDNVFIVTTNGLWRSVNLRKWADNPDLANLKLANLLYYPVYGQLIRLLDKLGVFAGLTWKQIAVLNAAFASIILGCIDYWISSIFKSRLIGLLTVLFYMGSGHFLVLSVINEDIMPSYFFVLVAMMLASVWFGAATTVPRIIAVALIFSIGWLFEWRLLFPVLPPMLLALWVSAPDGKQRFAWCLEFILGLCILPFIITVVVAILSNLSFVAATSFFGRLFWVGKGIGTGWAGFSLIKLHLTWVGIVESLLGGRYVQSGEWINQLASIWEVFAGTLLAFILAGVTIRYVWQRRRDASTLAHFIIFGGTFIGGEIFNLYSQPQDPQMQLTVMPWIIPAWGILMKLWLGPDNWIFEKAPKTFKNGLVPVISALVLSLFPMVNTVPVIVGERGGNARYLEILTRLEQQFDSSRTVFLYLGFDTLIPWQFTYGGATKSDVDRLPLAPASNPKFKYISITDGMIVNPDWSPEQQAMEVRRKIDLVRSLGYRVVTNNLWIFPEKKWTEITGTISGPETPLAIRRMLLQTYHADEVYVDPVEGSFFEIKLPN